MKLSNHYFYTKKEDAKDEESISANLLVRSGMIKKIGSGIYAFLPLGLKTFRKIENIVREEMDKAGSQELVMPSLLPESYYVDSGRRNVFGDDMFALKDRVGRDYVLGPTHEELFVEVCRDVIKSYKDMPLNLYQMANKYRDEPRSRYGLIRTREFVMKDAYSFDKDIEGLNQSYQIMFDAYHRIFDRIGLDYCVVKASSGAMGGLLSEEFQAITEIGEDRLVLCDQCGLSTNIEICECPKVDGSSKSQTSHKELFHTPNCGTIEELVSTYGFSAKDLCKTLIYRVDDSFYAFMVRGDRELNETKIQMLFNTKNVSLATFEEDEKITGAKVGFAGPIDLGIPIIMDQEILGMKDFIVGANQTDYHYKNVNIIDFDYEKVADIRIISEEDCCPKCGGKLTFKHGIEVGNTFKLGTKYSESMGLYFTDENNQLKPVVMGCYGIGIARILSAIVEQSHDDNGIIFPEAIAPYDCAIVVVNAKDEHQMKVANDLYESFQSQGKDVLFDDRLVSAGVKFKDMELIGIPYVYIVGKNIDEGKIEYKDRKTMEKREILLENLI